MKSGGGVNGRLPGGSGNDRATQPEAKTKLSGRMAYGARTEGEYVGHERRVKERRAKGRAARGCDAITSDGSTRPNGMSLLKKPFLVQ